MQNKSPSLTTLSGLRPVTKDELYSLSKRSAGLIALILLAVIAIHNVGSIYVNMMKMNHANHVQTEFAVAMFEASIYRNMNEIQEIEADSRLNLSQKRDRLRKILQPFAKEAVLKAGIPFLAFYSNTLNATIVQVTTPSYNPSASNPDKFHHIIQPLTFKEEQNNGYIYAKNPAGFNYIRFEMPHVKSSLALTGISLGVGLLFSFFFSQWLKKVTTSFCCNLEEICTKPTNQKIPEEFLPVVSQYSQVVTKKKKLIKELTLSAKSSTLTDAVMLLVHDIRNPIAVINASLDMAKEEPSPQISAATKTINELLDRLLLLVKEPKSAFEDIQPVTLIDNLLPIIKPLIKQKNIHFQYTHEPDLPQIQGNIVALQQAIMNILMNAIQATPSGGNISLYVQKEEDFIKIVLTDSGNGIPKEIKDKIFDYYFTTKDKSGMGIGLALAKNIIKKHKGNIHLDSTVGKGTVFYVKLPISTFI